MFDVYKNIKDRRLALGMTQTDLALKVGYSEKSSIARIEKGEIDLTIPKIKEFAKALDCTPSDLLGWDFADIDPNDIQIQSYEIVHVENKKASEIARIADKLDDYFLDKLLDYSKKLQSMQNELNS